MWRGHLMDLDRLCLDQRFAPKFWGHGDAALARTQARKLPGAHRDLRADLEPRPDGAESALKRHLTDDWEQVKTQLVWYHTNPTDE